MIKTTGATKIQKPDLVILNRKRDIAIACDATVVAGNTELLREQDMKITIYKNLDIHNCIKRTRIGTVTNAAVAVNWRGCIAEKSAKWLLELGKTSDLSLISAATCEGGFCAWKNYNHNTFQTNRMKMKDRKCGLPKPKRRNVAEIGIILPLDIV